MTSFVRFVALVIFAAALASAPPAHSDDDGAGVASRIPITAAWDIEGRHTRKWTEATVNAIDEFGSHLLERHPDDIEELCPRYGRLGKSERTAFWVRFTSELAFFESNFDPRRSYKEPARDSNGRRIMSRGLLQLSIESARNYGCEIRREKDLHDPEVNLTCAIRIMNHWIKSDDVVRDKDGRQWKGIARYWSPVRKSNRFRSIKKATRKLPFCT